MQIKEDAIIEEDRLNTVYTTREYATRILMHSMPILNNNASNTHT